MKKFDYIKTAAVIFDLDGTLIESMHVWHSLLPDFLLRHKLAASDEMLSRVAYMTLTQSSEYISKELPGIRMSAEEIRSEWLDAAYNAYSHDICLKAGTAEFISRLKACGIKIALATACAKKLTEACLAANGIDGFFDEIVYAEEIGCGKDSPRIYEETLRRLGCKAEESVLFEDILVAVQNAKKIGLRAIAVEDLYVSGSDEIKEAADMYIKDFTELL